MNHRDLVIIGGGAGGLVVASVAAQLGLKVTLIEKTDKLGGDCLHYGCVPSKTLIHAARVASLMRRGPEFGLPACDPDVDLGSVADHVQTVIDRIQLHDDPERFRGYGCEVLFGPAVFVDPHAVQVNGQVIRGRRFVIATGSQPYIPPIEGLEATGYLTNEELFSLRDLPERLVVLGGGPVGLEMAQAFARLGSRVTVVESLPHLLPQEDPEVVDALQEQLESEGIEVHTATTVKRVSKDNGATQLTCNNGLTLAADALLVAVGRRPVVDGLGLDTAGVTHDAKGIRVDRRQRTSQKHIYACGDVCGPYPLTHMAEYQAGILHPLPCQTVLFLTERNTVHLCTVMWRVTRHALVLGLLNQHSLLYCEKHGQGSYVGARWDTAREVLGWVDGLSSVADRKVRYGIFLPGGNRLARLAEYILPHWLPAGSFLAVALYREQV